VATFEEGGRLPLQRVRRRNLGQAIGGRALDEAGKKVGRRIVAEQGRHLRGHSAIHHIPEPKVNKIESGRFMESLVD
jgi:hypothetical protein